MRPQIKAFAVLVAALVLGNAATQAPAALSPAAQQLITRDWSMRNAPSTPLLLPGRLPPGLALELPPGAAVVGTLVWEPGENMPVHRSVVHLDLPGGVAALMPVLQRAGFQPMPGPQPLQFGFQTSDQAVALHWLLPPDTRLLVNGRLGVPGGAPQPSTQVSFEVIRGPGVVGSVPPVPPQPGLALPGPPPLPLLKLPPAATVQPVATQLGPLLSLQQVRVSGVGGQDALAHYVAELRSAGWNLRGEQRLGDWQMLSWELPGRRPGFLGLLSLSESEHMLLLGAAAQP